MFSVGDVVSYPMHGVGKIESIEMDSALGFPCEYYVLRFDEGRIVAMVPVIDAEKLGLRPILTPEACREVIEYISTVNPTKLSSDWAQRRRDIMALLHSGDLKNAVDVIITLSTRCGYRGLSTGEHRIIDAALKTIVSEAFVVLNMDEKSVMKRIDDRICVIRKAKQN